MNDIADEDPTDVSGLARWITSQIATWQSHLDEPLGGSGTVYLPKALGGSVGETAKISLHPPSPAYLCASTFQNLVVKLCSTSIAFELSHRFPDGGRRKVRDMILAMRWVAEQLINLETSCPISARHKTDASQAAPVRDDSASSSVTSAHSNNKPIEPKRFDAGQLVFFQDRVELCGADICSGPRCQTKRGILEVLSKKRSNGRFVAYSGSELAKELGLSGGQGTVSGAMRDLRNDITKALLTHGSLRCGRTEVILSGGIGYRFAESITVEHDGQQHDGILTTDGDSNVRGVRDLDVRDVREPVDASNPVSSLRQEWILAQLSLERRLKARNVADRFKISRKTAERDLTALREGGRIEYVGSRRNGCYRIRRPGQPGP
ncbi:MAG TPA: hypothetical protein VGN12_19950 [Pirellulales bacterium]|jgi:hypothetical protein